MAEKTKAERREAAKREAERLAKIQARQDHRNRTILIVVGVVVVALIAVAGFFIFQQSNKTLLSEFDGPVPAGADLQGGISFGSDGAGSVNEGAPTVDIYVDFMCSHCANFEAINGEYISEAIADGEATIVYHPVNYQGTTQQEGDHSDNSTRLANAFSVVATEAPEAALEFMNAVFAKQADGQFSDNHIAQIAVDAGVPQEVANTFTQSTYSDWISTSTAQARRDGVSGTPTIMINGEVQSAEDLNWTQEGALAESIAAAKVTDDRPAGFSPAGR